MSDKSGTDWSTLATGVGQAASAIAPTASKSAMSGPNLGKYIGARDTGVYGGGLQDRQFLDAQSLALLQALAGGGTSAAERQIGEGTNEAAARAWGLAASAPGVNVGGAMRGASWSANQAQLMGRGQAAAMNALTTQQAQQELMDALLQQQQINDAAAAAREQMLVQAMQGTQAENKGESTLAKLMKPGALATGGITTIYNWLAGRDSSNSWY